MMASSFPATVTAYCVTATFGAGPGSEGEAWLRHVSDGITCRPLGTQWRGILSCAHATVKKLSVLLSPIGPAHPKVHQARAQAGWVRLLLILAKAYDIPAFVDGLDRQAERLQFLDQHTERCRDTGFLDWLTLNDGLVSVDPALDIVRLDGEHLL